MPDQTMKHRIGFNFATCACRRVTVCYCSPFGLYFVEGVRKLSVANVRGKAKRIAEGSSHDSRAPIAWIAWSIRAWAGIFLQICERLGSFCD